MVKAYAVFVLAFQLVLSPAPADEPNKGMLDFPLHGFTIEPLEELSEATSQVLSMTLPVEEGFSANINVRVESYPQGIQKYIELSREQFKQHNFEVLNEVAAKESVVFEYKGTLLGREMHWYAKAVQKKDKIYLTTGTAKESQWQKLGPKLKKVVDSFKMTRDP